MSVQEKKTNARSYRSSHNIVLAIVINVTIIGLLYMGVQHALNGKWILPAIALITSVYLISTFYYTRYVISDAGLLIVSGFFKSRNYSIYTFDTIRKTRSLVAGAASGLRRLEINTTEGDQLIISPKDQDNFIDSIKAINPNIKVV